MRTTAVLIMVLPLAGCAGINSAGLAEYTVKPMVVDGRTVCCEASIRNGKEIAELDVLVEKTGENYKVHLRERGVAAFTGQKTAADVAKAGTEAAKAAASLIANPAGALVVVPGQ